jgi:hypothetical protein
MIIMGRQKGPPPTKDPTPREIEERAAEIRSRWKEHKKQYVPGRVTWSLPVIGLGELFDDCGNQFVPESGEEA